MTYPLLEEVWIILNFYRLIIILSIIIKRLCSLAPRGVYHEIQVRQIGEGAYVNEGKKEKILFENSRGNYHCSRQ